MNENPHLILLDTHIWIWFSTGSPNAVSARLRTLIDKLLPLSSVKISAISAWETGNLVSKNRIAFGSGVKDWVYRTLATTGIIVEPVTADIAIESTLLSGGFHGDPADRILLATAKVIGATLITHDKEILSYAKKHGLPALSM